LFRFLIINKKIIAAFLLLIGIFVLLSPEIKENPRYNLLERPFVYIINVVQSGFLIFSGFSETWDSYVNLIEVKEENKRLTEENKRLRSEAASLREKGLAYDRLIQLQQVKDTFHVGYSLASVIAKDPINWYRAVVINKGEEDGIKSNMGVITTEGVVGRIVKTSRSYSRVLLLSDRNSAIAGMIQRTRDEGIVAGGDERALRLNYITVDSDVEAGDIVITSGTDGIFPAGIIIGKVSRIESPENGLFHYIELTPDVHFSMVKDVMVLKTPGLPEIERLLKEDVK
jgi:rod shape-determining protein MreC